MPHPSPHDDAALQEALKRCSPATYYAACKFRQHGYSEDLRTLVNGVIERFVERDLRPKLNQSADALRLREDLAIDSLTMMEFIMVAEEVLGISVTNEELAHLRTLGEVHAYVWAKMRPTSVGKPDETPRLETDSAWAAPALRAETRRLETGGSGSITSAS
jgi:3-hydroxyacyl-[acyl-carrier-protein] dehydratase